MDPSIWKNPLLILWSNENKESLFIYNLHIVTGSWSDNMEFINVQQTHTDTVLNELNISAKILEQISEGVMVVNEKRQIIY
ncbi:hypothetical protein [Lederbergia citri]|uniref:Uncharacterized protein n=1 Tax=Lederbergia citri TaxID=2833580 RepID=A0A942TCW8_9BACI|nr:hypothetical protein [Lederbergia citri]MBS4194458.1 hypothetical protein [Lederbergia citri]